MASKKSILSAHAHFMLSKEDAEFLIDDMVNIIKKEWINYLHRAGVTEKDANFIATAFISEGFFYQ